MGGTVRVLTIRGIPINVHVSWLVIYGLITWTLAIGYFPHALPDLPATAYWANGLLAAFLLFVSVLLHELSHSFVAMAHGLSVRGSRCMCSAASRTWKMSRRARGPSS